MEFFDSVLGKAREYGEIAFDKAKEYGEIAVDKARDAKDYAKLKISISNTQRELNKNYMALGQWFASEYRDQAPEEVRDVLAAIDMNRETLKKLKEQLAASEFNVEEIHYCPICGAQSTGKFCPECGTEIFE